MMKPTVVMGVLAAATLALGGCGQEAAEEGATSMKENAQQVGELVDDATLTAKVKAALAAEDAVDGGAISVSTDNGQVTLAGTVPAEQIGRAEAIARGVEGVREVVNRLEPAAS